MPAFVVHALFGEEVLPLAGQQVRDVVEANRAAFEWGLQGPDLLFYNGALQPLANHTLNRLGNLIHEEQIVPLWEALCAYLRIHQDSPAFFPLLSYAMGFCCHYALDCEGHPYVFWRQRCVESARKPSARRGIHNRLESDLDTDYYYWKTSERIASYEIPYGGVCDAATKEAIAHLYHYLLWRVYDVVVATEQVFQCFETAQRVVPLLLGRVAPLLVARVADTLAMGRVALQAHVRRPTVRGDVLNLRHTAWRMPDGVIRTHSFPDLVMDAVKRATELQQATLAGIQQGFFLPNAPMLPFDYGREWQPLEK